MSNYNSQLQSNNTELEEILSTINSLPEAGGGNVITSNPDEFIEIAHIVAENALLNTDTWGGEYYLQSYRHFWYNASYDFDGIYVKIHVPAQTGTIVSSGELKVFIGNNEPIWWGSFNSDRAQPYFGYSTFIPTSGKEIFCEYTYDLREETMTSYKQEGQTEVGNYALSYRREAPLKWTLDNSKWCPDGINTTNVKGVSIELVSGSFPAGTNILIYGRKADSTKKATHPRWQIV